MKHFLPSCLAVILLSVASAAQTITSFDVPGGTNTQPIAISPAGAVTGSYAVPNTTRVRGFVRDLAGKIVTFDVAGANTYPASINLWGQITGIYTTNTYGVPPFHGFVRQPNGAIITFDAPNAWDTEATSINDSGEILGWMQSNYSATNWNVFQAFVRKADGTFKTFDIHDAYSILALSVNEKGQSIGYWTNTVATRTHGFLRQANGKIISLDVPDSLITNTSPYAINAWGQVAGAYTEQCPFPAGSCTTNPHGFLRKTNGQYVKFDVPLMTYTVPVGIDAFGNISGYTYQDLTQEMHGFVRDAKGNITTFDVSGSGWTLPLAGNIAGAITGVYYDAAFQAHGFVRLPW